MNEKQKLISITHINVRESMSFLIIKLIVIELALATIILASCLPLACVEQTFPFIRTIISPHTLLFLALTVLKIYLSIWIILQWLNEYYEITPTSIVHRSGIIFRHEEKYELASIGSLNLQQGFISKFLNYGTLYFYDKTARRYVYFYLIHNPVRYYHIIESLIPPVNKVKEVLRERVIEEQDESL